MDALFLARLQFAMTIGFHFLFPPLSIGLSWLLVIMEGMGWRKNDELYRTYEQILREASCFNVCSRCSNRYRYGIPIWHELGNIFKICR